MSYHIILLAAGQSIRLGGAQKKQFVKIGDHYLFEYALMAFLQTLPEAHIYLIVPKEDFDWIKKQFVSDKIHVVVGGNTRTASVRNGIVALPDEGIVLIHDSARPCVSKDLIEHVVIGTDRNGVSIPRIPVYDALRLSQKEVDGIVPRDHLFQIQTPQGFNILKLKQAYESFTGDAIDDATVYQSVFHALHYVHGSPENIKITDAATLKMATKLLA